MLACPPSILRTPRTRLSDAQSQAEARCQPSVGTEPSSNSRDQTHSTQPSELQVSLLVQAPAALRSAGRAPGSARGAAPAFGPLRPGCADARPHVDRPGGHELSTQRCGPRSQTMPPAGDRPAPGGRGRRSRLRAHCGERWGLPSRPPSTQAEPSRRGPWRPGRSYSGALHLDAMNHARSTVCGSTADGMGAGVSGGMTCCVTSGINVTQVSS